MLAYLRPLASQRKLLLFAVACCWRIRPYLPDERGQEALSVIEAAADGVGADADRKAASVAAHRAAAELYRPRP